MELVQTGASERVASAVSRWRQGKGEALLVIDQFEELFTLNPEETQQRFAAFLGRLTEEAGVHVLLSLRDDFLFRCHSSPSLAPVFRDVTPLGPPSASALRRALVEPAARLGVRFEDEALVDEMVTAVEKERGALPLLAFAVSRLWEERDRESKLLTRAAYVRIRGVEGALAEHAEAMLREIGPERERVVREIFRNLATAEGTRAAREREELLSVFAAPGSDRDEAEAILDVLVGARLLTEYDDPEGPEGRGRSRIEIVHESLLTHWPRLERWRAQDEEGALLRDQLRQAARLWDEKGRPEELLWTGQAYREYVTWRGRYEGSLSTLEEGFAQGMIALAGRRPRRRRVAFATLLAAAVGVAVTTASLWRRSETSRQKAEAETQRAEASKLLALGQRELETYPTAALAYVLKSLELADTEVGRLVRSARLAARAHDDPGPGRPGTRARCRFGGLQPERRMARPGWQQQGAASSSRWAQSPALGRLRRGQGGSSRSVSDPRATSWWPTGEAMSGYGPFPTEESCAVAFSRKVRRGCG